MGILGAVVRRMKTGRGALVEGSLFNAAIDLQVEAITNYLTGHIDRSRYERDPHLATWFHQAPYGIYETADGRHVAISLNDPQAFADALDDDGLRDFVGTSPFEERDRYAQLTAAAVRRYPLDELAAKLDAGHMWWAPVLDYTDLASNPQVKHSRVFEEVAVKGGKATLVNHPIRYDGEVPATRHLALDIGHDTREVLKELGYGPQDIDKLARRGAIGVAGFRVEKAA